MPFPPRAAAGEDDGSDEVSPAEPDGVPFAASFPRRHQESQQGQRQHRAPHSADAVLWQGQEGAAGRGGEFC